jgi:ABC-type phosphate transport system substrate-binding protein
MMIGECTHAGVTLTATVEAVESAMEEVYDLVNAGNLAVDVNNGSLPTSWPMCMLSFAVFYVNQSRADCSQLTEFIEFFAWAQLNQRADELMRSLGYAPLSLAYKAYVVHPACIAR